jgi:hypothetical protein
MLAATSEGQLINYYEASALLHEISVGSESVAGKHYCVVTIRLFANLAMPVYRVVAGILA